MLTRVKATVLVLPEVEGVAKVIAHVEGGVEVDQGFRVELAAVVLAWVVAAAVVLTGVKRAAVMLV